MKLVPPDFRNRMRRPCLQLPLSESHCDVYPKLIINGRPQSQPVCVWFSVLPVGRDLSSDYLHAVHGKSDRSDLRLLI